MDYAELQNQSTAELARLLHEQQVKLQALRGRASARTLKQAHEPKAVRRSIARIRTILNTRAHPPAASSTQ